MPKNLRDPFLILTIILALWSGMWLTKPGYFNMHDDPANDEATCIGKGAGPCRNPGSWLLRIYRSFRKYSTASFLSVLGLWGFRLDRRRQDVFFFLATGWFATFMAHVRSTPIWLKIPPLKFVQFPWRFITLSILSFSIVAGSLVTFLENRKNTLAKLSALALVVMVIAANTNGWKYYFSSIVDSSPNHPYMAPAVKK